MTYHFIITLAFGVHQVGRDDTYDAKAGETRSEAYAAIVEETKRRAAAAGIPTGQFATLFFSFEPNEIGS